MGRDPRVEYRMPAEWEPQEAVWLAWPHQARDWPGKFPPVPWVYGEFVRLAAAVQTVRLVVRDEAHRASAEALLAKVHADLDRVEWHVIPTDRGWLRDSGPVFVRDAAGRKTVLDWGYSGWAKYPDHGQDDRVPERANARLKLPLVRPEHKGRRVVLEGGGIDVNGRGSVLTTEEWLLSDVQVRNPGFTREDYEEVFARYLGATNTIWLGNGVAGDDTHGHVDDLARFVAPGTVVTVVERDRADANHAALRDNLRRLKTARDERGRQLTVAELPMPRPLLFRGVRLPASYANFLILNGRVLVPVFNDPNDRVALNTLAELFPRREVVGIGCVDFVWGLGTLHCASQQEPRIP